MPSLSKGTSAVRAIFSLDVITAALAFLVFALAVVIVITRVANGRIRSFERKTKSSNTGEVTPLKTTLSTHLFLIPAVFCLAVSYAVQSAVVTYELHRNSPVSITSTFNYQYAGAPSSSASPPNGRRISILTFTQQLAAILSTTFLTGAIWLHSSNLTSNGTQAASPKTTSRIWNSFIITAIAAFGIAAWALGLTVRGSGQNALTFPSTITQDRITRIIYIVFRCVVVFSSTSVSIQVLTNYKNLKANGLPQNSERPLLARFSFVVVPLIWLRNIFIIVNIVMIYENVSNWSSTTNQALTFLFIIFGQFTNLTILFMVLWGAWSMGRSAGLSGGSNKNKNRNNDSGSSYTDA
ncbi:hypothetical protein LTR70_009679 [Exophiala xenobiotica]|uniref:Uncharacterized protein n=1 Tax=Lithohypha guttulata TaxID=1690604 RepID=A0ABR0JXM6_9EURO|nr:hypothetical protein LTR24_009525 [Lithohypha guttulata]KAK5310177.1 hypothetical protein LTR70_009679 [Exophiala xenobiotica]